MVAQDSISLLLCIVAGFFLDIPHEPQLEEVQEECEFVNQLKNICCEETSFTDAVQKFPKPFDVGYTKPTVTFEEKKDLLNPCIKHIV